MIAVAQDAEGIRQAALTLFAESLAAAQFAGVMKTARARGGLPREQRAKLESEYSRGLGTRPLGEGYYARANYLLWLDQLAEARPGLPLTSEQFAGLQAVRGARSEFEIAHPPCAQCGARLESRQAECCWSCLQPARGAA